MVHLGQFHGARSWDENVNQMAAKDCEGIFEEWVVGKGVVELWGVAGDSCVLDAHTRMGVCIPTPHICRHTPECYVWAVGRM